MRICEQLTCNPEPYGSGLFSMARVLVALDGNRTRAIKLALRAREILGQAPNAFVKELKDVSTWLQKHAEEKLAKRFTKDNPR